MGIYYDEVVDFNHLFASSQLAQRGSSWKASNQKFQMNLLLNLRTLQKQLLNGTYQQKPFFEFTLRERGKIRHVRSQHIVDRTLQRAICDYVLIPRLTPKLIYDNGASIKNRGISFARHRLQAHLEKYVRKHGTEGYVLTIDFSKFFDNIPHQPVLDVSKKLFNDEKLLKLLTHLIDSFKIDVSYLSDEEVVHAMQSVFDTVAHEQIPAKLKTSKRFLRKSLGIGSQTSQLYGVYYPTPIDLYCKVIKRMKFYGRYMDDIYVIHHSKTELVTLLKDLHIISQRLGLFINDRKTRITPLYRGFSFMQVKYSILPSGKIQRRVKPDRFSRERRRLKKYKHLLSEGRISYESILNAYQSWRGNLMEFSCKESIATTDNLFTKLFLEDVCQKNLNPPL